MIRSRQEEEDEGQEKRTMCIHQFARPDGRIPGAGDCSACAPDPVNNPACSSYRPITISIMDIGERIS